MGVDAGGGDGVGAREGGGDGLGAAAGEVEIHVELTDGVGVTDDVDVEGGVGFEDFSHRVELGFGFGLEIGFAGIEVEGVESDAAFGGELAADGDGVEDLSVAEFGSFFFDESEEGVGALAEIAEGGFLVGEGDARVWDLAGDSEEEVLGRAVAGGAGGVESGGVVGIDEVRDRGGAVRVTDDEVLAGGEGVEPVGEGVRFGVVAPGGRGGSGGEMDGKAGLLEGRLVIAMDLDGGASFGGKIGAPSELAGDDEGGLGTGGGGEFEFGVGDLAAVEENVDRRM